MRAIQTRSWIAPRYQLFRKVKKAGMDVREIGQELAACKQEMMTDGAVSARQDGS